MSEEKYSVHLDNFDGPLDLLLHLIDKNKLDIYDIPIAEVTEQYMSYLAEAEQMDLEVASEFLVIAATLINIKARMLLPKKVLPDEEEADPRDELVSRLLEYKFYKEMALLLKDTAQQAGAYLTKEIDVVALSKDFTPVNPVANIAPEQLWQAFHEILLHVREEPPVIELQREEYDVEMLMGEILSRLAEQGSFRFQELFAPHDSKRKIISLFLAILELYKLHKLFVRQKENFADIWLYAQEEIA